MEARESLEKAEGGKGLISIYLLGDKTCEQQRPRRLLVCTPKRGHGDRRVNLPVSKSSDIAEHPTTLLAAAILSTDTMNAFRLHRCPRLSFCEIAWPFTPGTCSPSKSLTWLQQLLPRYLVVLVHGSVYSFLLSRSPSRPSIQKK